MTFTRHQNGKTFQKYQDRLPIFARPQDMEYIPGALKSVLTLVLSSRHLHRHTIRNSSHRLLSNSRHTVILKLFLNELQINDFRSKLTRISEEIKTPIAELRRKWREGQQNLTNPKVNHDRLALCVLIIIASTTIFALCILHHGLNQGNRNNLKYGSIEYGFHRRHQRDPIAVTDERGNVLGGKKAAIQFAHDLKKMKNEDQDIINRLSLKLSNNIKKVVSNNNAKPVQPLDVETIKKVQL